jgi:predicted RNase H-like HicB family nuclease
MTLAVRYGVAEARAHLKELLDAAQQGVPAEMTRDTQRFAVVDVARLLQFFTLAPRSVEVVAEAGGYSVFIPGTPIAADGATLDEALEEMVDALREYAADWTDRLSTAPNHRANWGLVQLVELSSDRELVTWLSGSLPNPVK